MKTRTAPAPAAQEGFGVVRQVRLAFSRRNLLATCLGILLGGFVPIATYFVAHYDVRTDLPLWVQSDVAIVLGGLTFSARTVFQWAALAFRSAFKALGFVVLAEGVMTLVHIHWLSIAALCYLVAINGVATGCNLTVQKQ